MAKIIVELDQWQRIGRGSHFRFVADEEVIQDVLNASLPEEYEPYSIINTFKVKRDRQHYEEKFHSCDVDGFVDACKVSEGFHFFIRSRGK